MVPGPARRRSGRGSVCVTVECLFLRRRVQATYGANQRAPKGRPTQTPFVVPHPESLAAQAAYSEAIFARLAWARIVSRHWGPPRACYRVPYFEYCE